MENYVIAIVTYFLFFSFSVYIYMVGVNEPRNVIYDKLFYLHRGSINLHTLPYRSATRKEKDAKKCLKNDDIGWRTGNIYSCLDPTQPVCCEIKREFTCCEEGQTQVLKDQIKMWVTVLLVVLLMSFVYIYLKKDIQVFSRPTIQDSVHHFKSMFHKNRSGEDINRTTRKTKSSEIPV